MSFPEEFPKGAAGPPSAVPGDRSARGEAEPRFRRVLKHVIRLENKLQQRIL